MFATISQAFLFFEKVAALCRRSRLFPLRERHHTYPPLPSEGEGRGEGGSSQKKGIHRRLAGSDGSGSTVNPPIEKFQFFYHGDHLGSSSFITDDAGAVYQHLEYFPYGETWVESGGSGQMPYYRFTGKELDPETGLYYYGARYYDPVLSRWISADPILDAYLDGKMNDGIYRPININLYRYTSNNPIRLLDPTGLSDEEASRPVDDDIEQLIKDRQWQLRNTQEGLKKIAPVAEAVASLNPLVSTTEAITGESSIERRELSIGERILALPLIGAGLRFLGLGGEIIGKAFAPGKWLEHFEKHAAEFGYKNAVEYLRGAQKLTSGTEKGVQTFMRSNGDTLFYKASTNEFAVIAKDGTIRTYFKPTEGQQYWLKQTGGQ